MRPSDYTKEKCKALCETFLAARNVICINAKTGFICNAIDLQYTQKRLKYWELEEAKRIIKIRMGHIYTLEDWLVKYHKVPRAKLTHTAMRQYRLAWLDHLIQEFSP